jgi:hypothetical protein
VNIGVIDAVGRKRIVTARPTCIFCFIVVRYHERPNEHHIALTAPLPATPTSIQKFHVKTKGL